MHHIVFDLEMTCWFAKIQTDENDYRFVDEGNGVKIPIKESIQEVIEIGAVRLDENLKVVDVFQLFVKPTINPILTGSCRNMTGITQKNVDNGTKFTRAMFKFRDWINKTQNNMLYSWGQDDKSQIIKEYKHKNAPNMIISDLNKHINLQQKVSFLFECDFANQLSLKHATELLNIPFKQRHRALDDAMVTAEILIMVLTTWREKYNNIS